MSFVGLVVVACLPPSVDLSRVASIDDLGAIQLDESASVIAFTRNGWLNNRVEEIARKHGVASLPTSEAPAVACVGSSLDGLIADLEGFLRGLRHDPSRLPPEAREQADDDEAQGGAGTPSSLEAAIAAFKAATARDEEGERLETLLCLLWCQLRLAEHARMHGLGYLCVRSP